MSTTVDDKSLSRKGCGAGFSGHLAIWEAPECSDPETEWGELVTDEQYRAESKEGSH